MKIIGIRNRGLQRLNKVLHKGDVKTIECISPSSVILQEDCSGQQWGSWIDLDEIEFIPLNDDHFKVLNNGSTYMDIYGDIDKGYFVKSGEDRWHRIDYLHQLQNLCFILFGVNIDFSQK